MSIAPKKFRKATLALIGTTIGAGVFALPAAFARVGFWPATLLFWFLALVVLAMHLLMVEVVLSHKKKLRLVGYAERELGGWGLMLAGVTYPLGIIGASVAYLILGGEFLAAMGRYLGLGGALIWWQLGLWVVVSACVYVGLKFVAKVEGIATWLLIAALVTVVVLAGSQVKSVNVMPSNWSNFMLPFGVFLFSLGALPVISETVEIAERNRKAAFRAVIMGSLAAAALSWLFGTALALASGGFVSRDPGDLIRLLPYAWAWIIPVFGFLAVITSYLTLSQDLKASFHLDFDLPKPLAWALAVGLPLIVFLIWSDFLSLIDVLGTVFGAIDGILVAMMASRLLQRRRVSPGLLWAAVIPFIVTLVFAAGIIYKLIVRVTL